MPTKPRPLGAPLAPPPSDIDEVLARGQALSEIEPLDGAMDGEFAGEFDKWTSPEARKARKNTVSHTTSGRITLYNLQGEDRTVGINDLQLLVDPSLPAAQRLFVRCPKCVNEPNRGIHPFAGPNGCPAREAQKYMTCPICARRGIVKRVYEEAALESGADEVVENDPNYMEPDLPDESTRKAMLQNKLELHMASFHTSEAEQLYHIRREPTGDGRGWRIVHG